MNIGEGAAMLVLEDLDAARRRGAPIYAEVAGHSLDVRGLPSDVARAGRPRHRRRDARARSHDAGVDADEVDHVNAHGTATPHNDRAEARGIRLRLRRAGGAAAGDVGQVDDRPLPGRGGRRSRPRSSALTIARGVIPPTIHHGETDPECDVDVVANNARATPVRCAVSTSLAFGGNDSVLVLRAV